MCITFSSFPHLPVLYTQHRCHGTAMFGLTKNCSAQSLGPVRVMSSRIPALLTDPRSPDLHFTGPALTFSQMLFITLQQLPSFVTWDASRPWRLPRLEQRQVPITQWLLQVTTFASGTLLNNLVFAFSVPLALQIVFRSAGTYVSLLHSTFSRACTRLKLSWSLTNNAGLLTLAGAFLFYF